MRLLPLLSLASLALGWPITNELRTLQLSETQIVQVTEYEKLKLKRQGVNFFDISQLSGSLNPADATPEVPLYNYPTQLVCGAKVEKLIKQIDQTSMQDNLRVFTNFYTRYYKSETGLKSAYWLSEKLTNVTECLGENRTQIHIDHHDWNQFSIIVRIKGSETPENIVVFGSHQDSMNLLLPSLLPAPGADDNGSGTITNIEALRIYSNYLAESQDWPKNTIEFHFYSAEEGGLLGSLDVFTRYAELDKKVIAMLQQDMTGYVADPDNEHVGVITDYTTPGLTNFIELVIDEYLDIPYIETECGYACSDHGSATRNGFPAAFVIESEFSKSNRYIHSTMDTMDRLNLQHMAEHVKLVVGATLELGHWDTSFNGTVRAAESL